MVNFLRKKILAINMNWKVMISKYLCSQVGRASKQCFSGSLLVISIAQPFYFNFLKEHYIFFFSTIEICSASLKYLGKVIHIYIRILKVYIKIGQKSVVRLRQEVSSFFFFIRTENIVNKIHRHRLENLIRLFILLYTIKLMINMLILL